MTWDLAYFFGLIFLVVHWLVSNGNSIESQRLVPWVPARERALLTAVVCLKPLSFRSVLGGAYPVKTLNSRQLTDWLPNSVGNLLCAGLRWCASDQTRGR